MYCIKPPPPALVQAYFDRYITETPLPISIWFAVTDSINIDRKSPGELTMRDDDYKVRKTIDCTGQSTYTGPDTGTYSIIPSGLGGLEGEKVLEEK